jgi:hypothetical protein
MDQPTTDLDTIGEDLYAAFGQTVGGRYLSVFFIYKPARKIAVTE